MGDEHGTFILGMAISAYISHLHSKLAVTSRDGGNHSLVTVSLTSHEHLTHELQISPKSAMASSQSASWDITWS